MRITVRQSLLLVLIVVLGILASSALAQYYPSELVVPLVIVEGRSMLPLLSTGDVVVVVKVLPEDIKPGDVIVFKSVRGHLVIHRVLKVRVIGGEYYYITKGDNNLAPDYLEFSRGLGVPYYRVVGAVASVAGVPLKIPVIGLVALVLKGLLGLSS